VVFPDLKQNLNETSKKEAFFNPIFEIIPEANLILSKSPSHHF
jgi:hypothetical protein